MSVKEKAKAFEGRSSVIGESPPPIKKSREELIDGSGDDNFERLSSSGTPEPPPRKNKRNGKIKSSGEHSPRVERKENIPVSGKDSQGHQKPPRPPPPPRGSSLGRKSELLSNLQSKLSVEKKKKPPVPPKPKNYVSRKASLRRDITVKSEKKIVSQPIKDGSGLALPSSTNSVCETQCFAPLEKDTSKVVSTENHKKNRSSQFFVSLEEKTPGKFSYVENGFVDSSGVHKNGVATEPLVIEPEKVNFEKNMADPLDGLEIPVDDGGEDYDILSIPPEGKNVDGEFSEPMDVNVEVCVGDAVNDSACDEFQPADGVKETEETVRVLYSVELEEECSVTRIENDTKGNVYGIETLEIQGGISAENNEVVEVSKDESVAGNLLSENIVGQNSSQTTNEVKKDKMEEELSVIKFLNDQEEMESNFEAEEQVDSVLENLSEEAEEIILTEDSPFDEVQCETELDTLQTCRDSTELNRLENVTDESREAVMEGVTEGQQNESCKNSEVIMAEPIREGTLLSVTDRVISKEISDTDEDKNQSKDPTAEKLEDDGNEDHPVLEHQHQNEEFMEKNELEFVSTRSGEKESCQDMAEELEKTVQSGEQLLENSVSEHFCQEERKDGQMEFVCVSGKGEQPKVEEEVSSLENTEGLLYEVNNDQDESAITAIPDSKEEDLDTVSSELVHVEQTSSQENVEAVVFESKEDPSESIVNVVSNSKEDPDTASSGFVYEEQPTSHVNEEVVLVEMEKVESECFATALSTSTEEDLNTASSEFVDEETPPSLANKEVVLGEMQEAKNECIVNAISISTDEDLDTASCKFADVEQLPSQENEDDDDSHLESPQPVPPERPSRKAKKEKHVYENIDLTSKQLEKIKSKGDSLRKTQSFSKYETVVLSMPRPVQRVSDDEVIYRVPGKVIPVDSFLTDEAEYSVPLPISSRARSVTEGDEYAVPKSIIVKACAVTDSHGTDDREIYSVPGQVTPVPVVEKFSDSSSRQLVQAVPQENDGDYAVPVQDSSR
ncbi:uncharacterized protein LOC111342866 [Stylophora pistillata]|uniref:uncharacterized protein LOC111342866 n=1 Tax=Stylophora pistillata TaxID=50429 RepID=UPI000C03B801|nr:uncharacterized protein LOC111342866 [Stylophora pistillata]